MGDGHAAIVRGCAINQDGRSSILTAPNGPSQQQVSRHRNFFLLASPQNYNALLIPVKSSALQMHATGNTGRKLLGLWLLLLLLGKQSHVAVTTAACAVKHTHQ